MSSLDSSSSLPSAATAVHRSEPMPMADDRAPAARNPRQAPLTDKALAGGLAVLARALARRHPGRRFVFESRPGHDDARLVVGWEIVRPFTPPEDAHAALVDRNGLRSAPPADV